MEIVNGANFDEVVLQSNKPVLVDFCASWCHPCSMLHPIIEEISREYADKIKVVKVDVDASAELASAQGVLSVPTLILYINGTIAMRTVGFLSKEDIVKQIVKELELRT